MISREQLTAARREVEEVLPLVLRDPNVGGPLRSLLLAQQVILLAVLDGSGLESAMTDVEHAAIMTEILDQDVGDR